MSPGPFSVSVVIPAYNAERFLRRTIESVLRQTLPPLEIIVVDDGSSDGTGEVARTFGGLVRCIRQQNAGPAAARNRGIEEAEGEFVAFLDADDEWLPDHLQKAAQVLTANGHLQWYCAPHQRRAEDGSVATHGLYEGPLENNAYIDDFLRVQARRQLSWTGVMVIRRQVLIEVGGFDESIRPPCHWEDTDLWFRIGLKYPQIGFSKHATAIYWTRTGSLMERGRLPSPERYVSWLKGKEEFALQLGAETFQRAKPVLRRLIKLLIGRAAREGNRKTLKAVRAHFRDHLDARDRLRILMYRFVPGPVLRLLRHAKRGAQRLLVSHRPEDRPRRDGARRSESH